MDTSVLSRHVSAIHRLPLQVLHCCAMLAPNQDTAFMISLVWTTVQLLFSTFFISFNEVRTLTEIIGVAVMLNAQGLELKLTDRKWE